MSEKVQSAKPGKFLFDKNIFDDDYAIIKISEPEPPPIFSLEELENAKRDAFEKGRQVAMREANTSREEHVAAMIAKISADVHALFAAEHLREITYEQESVRLAAAMLKKLFPAFEKQYGQDELKQLVSEAIEKGRSQADIIMETHPANIEGIEAHIQTIKTTSAQEIKFRLVGNDQMPKDGCKIVWSDGGMVRDSEATVAQIQAIMEEMLAAKSRSSHSG